MDQWSKGLRLLRTVRHLRVSQVAWRIAYRGLRGWEGSRWSPTRRRLRGAVPLKLDPAGDFPDLPVHRANRRTGGKRLAELQQGRLTLLNLQRDFRYGEGWMMTGGRVEHRLWTYNLHYHEWLLDLVEDEEPPEEALRLLRRILRDWVATCLPGTRGFTHYPWNSYTIATRIEWWIRILSSVPELFWMECAGLRERLIESLAMQAAYLNGHLEWDLRGNHLLRDARGLALAGRFFEGPVARRWLDNATRLAGDQAAEQVLPDGGHFERSAMYHVHVMDDLLVLALLLHDQPVVDELRETWLRMAEFAAWMRHSDGEIPLLNDAALGTVSRPGEMLEHGARLGASVDARPRHGGKWFPDTGVVAWQGRPWTLFFDVGPLGAPYATGHGHADSLTLECSHGPHRLFVDPGTHSYDDDDRRRYDRSTSAHNTVCIDGKDSSEVWDIFRVGRRARTEGVAFESSAGGMKAEAAHNGYRHLPGSPVHARRVVVDEAGWTVVDRIEGSGRRRIEAGFLVAPGWTVTGVSGGWNLTRGGSQVELRVAGVEGLRLGIESRPYHPSYGVEIETARVTWCVEADLPVEIRATVR